MDERRCGRSGEKEAWNRQVLRQSSPLGTHEVHSPSNEAAGQLGNECAEETATKLRRVGTGNGTTIDLLGCALSMCISILAEAANMQFNGRLHVHDLF
jgi:hypothetical protein